MKYTKGTKATLSMPISIKSIDKENFKLTMVASTQDVDRHGDVVLQSGWDLKPFNENPVILNSHNYGDITEVIARATRTEIVGKGKRAKLEQDWVFAVNENPKAKIAFDLYAGGFLSASSVGFIPKKFKQNGDGTTDWFTIEEAELLEVSAVSVPANARALAKSKGIEVPEDMVESEHDNEDEIPEDNEDENGDEGAAAGDGDGSESGSGDGDDGSGDGAADGDGEGDDTVEEEEEEQDEAPVLHPAPAKSYSQMVLGAINRIEGKRAKQIRVLGKLLISLAEGEPGLDRKTAKKVESRKLNQMIRTLMKMR